MKRLIFINRFFFPDQSATSQILSGLAFHLAASGRDVHVVTSRQRYEKPDARLLSEETIKGVCVHRVSSTQFGRSTLSGRAVDYLSFYASVARLLLTLVGRDDILIAKTDPPMIASIAKRAAERRGASLVNWLQDIYPEVAIELGVPLLKGPVNMGLIHLRDNFLKSAAVNIVVGEAMAERVVSRGISDERVRVIQNWADDGEISPVRHEHNPLRKMWGLEDKYVVGYAGNLGRAHEFLTVLGAAEQLRSSDNIVFLVVGGGHQREELAREASIRGLNRKFRFVPYQDGAQLKYALNAADIHWISLKPEVEGLIFPSKFYGIAAAGRPIVAITAQDGEIAHLVRQHDCGVVVEPGDASKLAAQLLPLSTDHGRNAIMGVNARAMLDTRFTRREAFEKWRSVLDAIG